MIAESAAGVANIATAVEEFQRAAQLFGMVATLRRHMTTLVRGWATVDHKLCIKLGRGALTPDAFERCWSEGEQMSIVEGVETATAACSSTVGDVGANEPVEAIEPTSLTPRELEVLRLLDAGLSDREIGEALFIAPRTASFHVTNLLGKLDVDSRTAAATFAIRHRLV